MDTIALIKAEIERLYNGEAPKHDQQCNFNDGYFTGIDTIAQFIDTLEPEKPMNQEGLEKEIDKIWKTCEPVDEGMGVESTYMHIEAFNIIARHFYDLGCTRTAEKYDEIEYNRQRAEKSVPNDLKEAANEFAEGEWDGMHDDDGNALFTQDYVEYSFIAGAKWQKQHDAELIEIAYNDGITIGMTKQKEQMLKEAVEGRVQTSPLNGPLGISAYCCNFPPKHPFYHCKEGDKVRIIIVKEDEK